jgi:hypothetical protein
LLHNLSFQNHFLSAWSYQRLERIEHACIKERVNDDDLHIFIGEYYWQEDYSIQMVLKQPRFNIATLLNSLLPEGQITYHQRHRLGSAPEGSGVHRKHHLHFGVPHDTELSKQLSQTHYPAESVNPD